VKSLYRGSEPEPLRKKHARVLIELIQEECPQLIGEYVWPSDLEKTYRELCEKKGWQPFHWTGIGRQLAELTDRITKKPGGRGRRAYRIPRRRSSVRIACAQGILGVVNRTK
jgi:hypothetical protein